MLLGYVNFVLRRPGLVAEGLQLRTQFPASADSLVAKGDSVATAVVLGLLAQTRQWPESTINEQKLEKNARTAFEEAADLMKRTFNATVSELTGAPQVLVFANGDIRGVATGESTNATNGTGSLGITLLGERTVWQAQIAVASTSPEAIARGFGATVLTPGRGKSLSSGLLALRVRTTSNAVVPYVFGYVSTGSYTWRSITPRSETEADTTDVNANVLGLGVLSNWEIACCVVGGNEVQLTAKIGPTFRWLHGDVSSRDGFRDSTLKTTGQTFSGVEAGVHLSIGRVIGSLQAYYLEDRTDKKDIDGLTGLQLVAAFTVAGDIFRGPLTRR